MTSTSPLAPALLGSFGPEGGRRLAAALSAFFEARETPPEILAFGEPTHLEPAFGYVRNRMLRELVGHGFRSVALESDRVAALRVDAFVRGGTGTLDRVMAEGFSHDFGRFDANRELVAWLRAYNDGRPDGEQVAFHGFDAPVETMSAPAPRALLLDLHRYLTEHLGPDGFLHGRADLERLLGDDERWSSTAAVLAAEHSPGASAEASALRGITDDLLVTLNAQAPRLVAATSLADWRRARTHGRAAMGLLRYHAQLADPAAPAERLSRMSAVRDALMVENLHGIRDGERGRGPTLVCGHNAHLRRDRSSLRMGGMDVVWFGAGAVLATLVGDGYAFVAGSLGRSVTLGLDEPPAGTYEGALRRVSGEYALLDARRLLEATGDTSYTVREDVRPEQGYAPLDDATLRHCDAVLHIAAAGRGRPGEEGAGAGAGDGAV
ncbi:erythromycin esterase family protein [Streptomyces lavendulocolor]|uniref:erythromycin esterase family protein n=1 Tax=Streptomyces lavendulocolor TaxID=67316 RepID=UPI003C2DDC2E